MLHNTTVRRSFLWTLMAPCAGLFVGCGPAPIAPVPPKTLDTQARIVKNAAPVPKNMVDVQNLGIPVYPGATIAEEGDSTTVDEKLTTRVYKVKMYAPAPYTSVLSHYVKSIQKSKVVSTTEVQKITGTSSAGDALEVWIGAASGKDRSLIMAWLTQEK